jgi:hypothetical protein
MTDLSFAPAARRAPAVLPVTPKAPRATLARLRVVADICPQVFLRTLGLIAQRDIVPLSMAFERRATRLHFEFELEGLSDQASEMLAAKVAELVRVRSARWVGTRKRS